MDPELERRFLTELEALEKFRIGYVGSYPNVPLAREDPDMRRLVEALAFFTARTRLAAERTVGDSVARILRQQFAYLLSPVPAMVMLRATPTRRYVDVSTLPEGSQVDLVSRGESGADRALHFRTLAPLRILPLEILGVDTLRDGARGWRVVIRIAAPFARNDDLNDLLLHVDYLNDLHSSLVVLHELRAHVRRVSAVWSHRIDATTPGDACELAFGPDEPPPGGRAPHPLERVRSVLRFPQQELFVRVRGLRAPRNWRELAICIDLDAGWPATLGLNAECFHLHVVPAVNVRRDTADPVEHDGTRDSHLIRHPDASAGLVPIAIQGVYRTTKEGLEPLEPSVFGRSERTWEAIAKGKGKDRRVEVSVALPGAFEQPETVVVDATWHQPATADARAEDQKVRLGDRFVDGVDWGCFGAIAPPGEVDVDEDRQAMLDLLSIKSRRVLGLDELRVVLRALGVHRERPFAKIASKLARVASVEKPHARRGNSRKRVYELTFDDLTPSDLSRLEVLGGQLRVVLGAWSSDEVVEVVARVPNLARELRFT